MLQRARHILERFLLCHADVEAYLEYTKFEMKHGDVPSARAIFERCTEELSEDLILANDKFFTAFTAFEERYHEVNTLTSSKPST